MNLPECVCLREAEERGQAKVTDVFMTDSFSGKVEAVTGHLKARPKSNFSSESENNDDDVNGDK